MQLTGSEKALFEAACLDDQNVFAQELMNLFGCENSADVLAQLNSAPIGVFVDVLSHIWYAVVHEARRQDERWGEMLERAV